MFHADHDAMYMTEEEQRAATAECRSGLLAPDAWDVLAPVLPGIGRGGGWRGGVSGGRGGVVQRLNKVADCVLFCSSDTK